MVLLRAIVTALLQQPLGPDVRHVTLQDYRDQESTSSRPDRPVHAEGVRWSGELPCRRSTVVHKVAYSRPGPTVTFRNTWVKPDSSTSNQLRETDACNVVLTPNPNSSQCRICPGQDSEQNCRVSVSPTAGNRVLDDDQTILQIDLRVNGIPSNEIYEDEQYMQSITKQIEKTCRYGQKVCKKNHSRVTS